MGADEYIDLSSSTLDKDAGIDGVKLGKDNVGIALRIRKPQYKRWKHNFTLGHHFNKENSQIHVVLNALRPKVLSPNYILPGSKIFFYKEELDAWVRSKKRISKKEILDEADNLKIGSYGNK